ncbi:MAG: RagB/SusD family nutrient uptake outer membrane protein, partial [Bacteroidetes bacterium]|nr:RagB/SusD family nutrient uptake outer membrane protein [Bacteroidota bacterium]
MKRYIILLTCMTALLASCKKQLKEVPASFLTPDNFYQNAADAQSAINGVLSALQPQAYYQRTIYIITELPADCLTPLLTQNQERIDMYKLQYTPTNPEISNWWQNSYKLISRANDVIAHVPAINMDVTARNNIVGNAYFLRGMAYFDLVRSFGDVPLLLVPITSPSDSSLFPTRTAAASVYQQVISDLKYAEANCLPEDKILAANKGMVSSGAASAMLARVYLQRASTAWADAQDNQNALAQCNKVINSKLYSLMPNYSDVFNWNLKFYPNQKEVIFAVQFGSNGSNITQNITCRMFSPSGLGGSGSFQCNTNFFNNGYPADDVIRSSWNISNKVGTATVAPFIYKYRDPEWVSGTNNSKMNWIVLRYADVLLMQSEAMNNLTPTDPAKFTGINLVRARAGLTSPTQQYSFTNVATQTAFVDTLVSERARELCVEGHRRWDLIRLGRYKQVEASIGFTLKDNQNALAQCNKVINSKLYSLMP